jgi:glucose-specific phosphotransferase system IIA component
MAKLTLLAPITGRLVPLQEVPDEAFAEGMMGEGVAIDPAAGEVRAPVDGEVVLVFPTGHAVALTTKEGAEILIHCGIDSVQSGVFQRKVEVGQSVKAGDLLLTFDLGGLKAKARSTISPVILTSLPEGMSLEVLGASGTVKAGETPILALS